MICNKDYGMTGIERCADLFTMTTLKTAYSIVVPQVGLHEQVDDQPGPDAALVGRYKLIRFDDDDVLHIAGELNGR